MMQSEWDSDANKMHEQFIKHQKVGGGKSGGKRESNRAFHIHTNLHRMHP